jgi:cytochrome oxidase Cu insertion factor (SCO1/SenC/PrrC family)
VKDGILKDLNTGRGVKSPKHARGRNLAAALLGLLLCCAPGARVTRAQSDKKSEGPRPPSAPHASHRAGPPAQEAPAGQQTSPTTTLPDVPLLNQDGEKIRFYSDLIKGKVFVISFVFTTCTYICPMQGQSLSKIQDVIGERLGKDVNLIAVSADPETDTPARLKAWGAQFGAKPGWTLVTGEKAEINKVAMALTGAPASKGEHAPLVFIGSDGKGTWVRTYGLAGPAMFTKLIEEAVSGSRTDRGAQ